MEIRVLGPLEVVGAAQPLDLGGPRQRTVLARLLLDADREVSVDALIDAVWLDRPPATAVKTLRGYVSRLRHVLATTPIRIDGSARGYRLVTPEGCIDARRFAAAAAGVPPTRPRWRPSSTMRSDYGAGRHGLVSPTTRCSSPTPSGSSS